MATKDTVPTLLEVASTIHEMQRTGARSLSESTAKARLNPVVMMSEPFTRLEPEIIHSINQVHLSIYSAMYIQVIQLYDKGGKIRSSGILDATSDAAYSMESRAADRGMDWINKQDGSFLDDFSLEAAGRIELDVSKPVSLAVGKLIDVPIGGGDGNPQIVKVSVVINPRVLNTKFLMKVLAAFIGKDQSMIGRWHRWQAGEIKSFMDYILCLDMLEEDRQLRLEDPDGFYVAAKTNRGGSMLNTVLTGNQQLNVASNIVAMTKTEAEELESVMRGKFSSASIRQKFFENTGAMMLTVVNPLRETVTIYQRGINTFGVYSYLDLKPAATNPNHADINAIMKAYKEGMSFTL